MFKQKCTFKRCTLRKHLDALTSLLKAAKASSLLKRFCASAGETTLLNGSGLVVDMLWPFNWAGAGEAALAGGGGGLTGFSNLIKKQWCDQKVCANANGHSPPLFSVTRGSRSDESHSLTN